MGDLKKKILDDTYRMIYGPRIGISILIRDLNETKA